MLGAPPVLGRLSGVIAKNLCSFKAKEQIARSRSRFVFHSEPKEVARPPRVGSWMSPTHWARCVTDCGAVFTLYQFDPDLLELFTVVCRKVRHEGFRKFVQYYSGAHKPGFGRRADRESAARRDAPPYLPVGGHFILHVIIVLPVLVSQPAFEAINVNGPHHNAKLM